MSQDRVVSNASHRSPIVSKIVRSSAYRLLCNYPKVQIECLLIPSSFLVSLWLDAQLQPSTDAIAEIFMSSTHR